MVLVALLWSTAGVVTRHLEYARTFEVTFWRALFASSFLLLFMLWREGPKSTLAMFRNMGLPGLGVAVCFGVASSCFVVALQYTTVANILLTQAAAPLSSRALTAMAAPGARARCPWAISGRPRKGTTAFSVPKRVERPPARMRPPITPLSRPWRQRR